MRKLIAMLLLSVGVSAIAQQQPAERANYQLASRFSTGKLERMIFSTSVDPHWLKGSDRFWYSYETTAGKKWYLVDPAAAQKKLLFDNDKMAAELTKIVRDPFDAQHLLIDSILFIKNENSIQFQVKSSLEIEIKDSTVKKDTSSKKKVPGRKEIKTFYFEYELATGKLTELTDYKKQNPTLRWASVSPDKKTIVFTKNYDLYFMDAANYEKAMKNEDDSTIVETRLTKDGVEFYSYGGGGMGNENNVEKIKNKNKRKPSGILWSPDSRHFAINRVDQRKLNELWVINSIAEPRPTLETYKYQMPGEKEAAVEHLLIFDITDK